MDIKRFKILTDQILAKEPKLGKFKAKEKARYILELEEEKLKSKEIKETDIFKELTPSEFMEEAITTYGSVLKRKKHEKEQKKQEKRAKERIVKTQAEERKRFELIQPSYVIVNFLRDKNDVYTATELVEELKIDIYTVKTCLLFLRKAGVIYHCKVPMRLLRWNRKAKKVSHYGLKDNMTKENVVNNVRFIFNLNRKNQEYMNLFVEIGRLEFRLINSVNSIRDDERIFWLSYLNNAKMNIVNANKHNANYDHNFVNRGSYEEIEMIVKLLKEKFAWT